MTSQAHPRKRLVNFRVTEEEYLQIRQACLAHGSRGLSDYARWAMLDSLRRLDLPNQVDAPTEQVINWLDDRFRSLELSIRRLLGIDNTNPLECAPIEKSGDSPRYNE